MIAYYAESIPCSCGKSPRSYLMKFPGAAEQYRGDVPEFRGCDVCIASRLLFRNYEPCIQRTVAIDTSETWWHRLTGGL